MKKNRNAFFNEANMSYQGYNPNMNMPGPAPFQAQSSYNSFYAGPNPNMAYNNNDLESRLAKIERQINRLDHRLTKLETTTTSPMIDDYDTNTTNMYML